MRGHRCRTSPLRWSAALAACLGALSLGCTPTGASAPPDAGPAAREDSSEAEARSIPDKDVATVLIRGGRVFTGAGVSYDEADVLLERGKVSAVGPKLDAPEGAIVVDAKGKTVTPGIIDTHSHMGVYASPGLWAHSDGNEMVSPVTAYARAEDGYWPQDPQVDYARAGGVTTIQVLPGSANLIGGRSVVLKLHPDARSVDDARFPGAPDGLKMACGENPKRVYGEKGGPATRMGNVAGYRKAFQQALEYKRRLEKRDAKEDPEGPPPSRDFALETLAGVLDGSILVHNHCYRADEMSLMLGLAEEFGFQIRSFHHAVEAYKIADRLAEAGTAASIWADWWGFKAEAYDGVRENAAILSAAGGRSIIHSDSPDGIQRLNQEAAKAMYAGRRAGIDISEEEAMRWITSNPAWALGIQDFTGTLEAGKMADVVIWDGPVFSVYSHAERVYIDGSLVYDREDPETQPRTDFDLGFREGDLDGDLDDPPSGPAATETPERDDAATKGGAR